MIGQGPGSLGPEEACSALSSANVARPPVLCRARGFSPRPRAGSLPAKWGACVRTCAPAGCSIGVPALASCSLRAPSVVLELSSAGRGPCPMPNAHIRVQLSSMFPSLPGPSLPQRGVGLGVGEGSVPWGPPPPQRLPSRPSLVLAQALSSPLINRPGTAPLMVSLAAFPQATALGQPAFPSETLEGQLLKGPVVTSRAEVRAAGSSPPSATWVRLPRCLGAQHCGRPAGRVLAYRLQGCGGRRPDWASALGQSRGAALLKPVETKSAQISGVWPSMHQSWAGPNTQSPLTGHWPVRTGTGGACETARIVLCPQAPIQARSPDPSQPHLRALTDPRAAGPH